MASIKIPLFDLKRQHDFLAEQILGAISKIIEESAFISGRYVQEFEAQFAQYCETNYCIGVANGTDALTIALTALGIGQGDEVISTACSFFATTEAIGRVGARPVFCDIDPFTGNIDTNLLEACITPASKAIIPVHLYGQATEMGAVVELARQYNLFVVEDCAQAAGACYDSRRVGSIGDIGCFSFYPTKNLGGIGDGGAIVTNNAEWADRCRMLANHGGRRKYEHRLEGFNSRLDALQAAVLSIKLHHLDQWNDQRRQLAELYSALLADAPVELLGCIPRAMHVFHLYTLRTPYRDRVLKALLEAGIGAEIHYPNALPFLEPYRYYGYTPDDYPAAFRHSQMVLSLPIFPFMRENEVERVAAQVIASIPGHK